MRRVPVLLAVAVGLAGPACTTTVGGKQSAGAFATPSTAPALESGPDGPYAVGERTETLVDDSRPTDPNRGAPGEPDRTLDTLVFYPADGAPGGEPVEDAPARASNGPYPLVVFSHGFLAHANVYRNLVRWWAAAGYVVAAPTFPLSSTNAPGGPQVNDYRNQPDDVSFVIDEMLRINGDRSHPLAGLVDETRIGVSGHSLGGLTTFGVAFNSCCVDERIKAAVPMSGLRLPFIGSEYFPTGVDTPVLIIHGDADELVPVTQSHRAYAEAEAPKYLLLLQGEDHALAFISGRGSAAGTLVVDASIGFFDRYLKGRDDGIDRLQEAVTAEGKAELRVDDVA
jgi:fermentation-respiration switch protein FrsA (DUF1100 family)